MKLEEKISQGILTNHLIGSGDKVLIGISGGADSVALLILLKALQTKLSFRIHAGHINHRLRKSAKADQNFVEKLCKNLNISCTCLELDLSKKIEQGGSVEEISREGRLEALIKIAKRTGSNKIALAHHKDDLAETVLLRILRGTGLQGLQAILPLREINGYIFIRPLLNISKTDIEFYLKKNKSAYRTDPTNVQIHFFRNKIRKELIPLLERRYQRNIKEVLCNLAVISGEDYAYLRAQSLRIFSRIASHKQNKISIALKKLSALPVSIKRMVIRIAIEKAKGNTRTLTLAHIVEIEDLIISRPAGSIVNLPDGHCAAKTKMALIFS